MVNTLTIQIQKALNDVNRHKDLRLFSIFKSLSLIMSVAVCGIGLLVLYGWLFNITLFKSILPNFIAMKPNSALAFVLTSISLLLLRPSQINNPFRFLFGRSLGLIIATFGLLSLFELILGYNVHPHIFAAVENSLQQGSGRSAPMAIITFIFVGISLLFLNINRLIYFSQILYALIGLTGLLILTGYFFSFHSESGLNTVTHSSLYTAFGFVLISLSLFFMHPSQGVMSLFISQTNGGTVARRLIPIVIIAPILFGYLRILGEYYQIYNTHTGIEFYSICITIVLLIVTILISSILMQADKKRLRIEEKLRLSNLELGDLYNNSPCGYHSVNEDGIIIHINKTELDWLQYTEEEVIGKMKVFELMTPPGQRFFHDNFEKFKKAGEIHDVEFEMLRKDGTSFHVLLNATAVYDANGKFLMSRSTIFDVSERKRIEHELRVSEERFHSAMDTAPIGMAIVSLDGKHIEVNQALCQLLGYSKEELQNMSFSEITHPDDLEQDVTNAEKLIEGKIHLNQIEKRYIRKNGEIIWVQLTASLLKDSLTGTPLYFIAQIEDITDRKLTEERIRHLAYHDSLTNLPNRRLLLDRLTHAIDFAKRHQNRLALMFMDLDKFKIVNDSLGHDVGDELLKAVAVRLNTLLRSIDTVARISGDEFVIILNELRSPGEASIIARKIIENMHNRFLIRGHELQIGCSIGITIFPDDSAEISDLMRKADLAMYQAKESGRNQYRYYH